MITYFYEQNSIRDFRKIRSICFAVEKTPAKSKAYNENGGVALSLGAILQFVSDFDDMINITLV